MASKIIDFHAHVFPGISLNDKYESMIRVKIQSNIQARIQPLRKKGREWLAPFSNALHKLQPIIRHIPEPFRDKLDQIGGMIILPHLLLESTPTDLKEKMKAAKISHALILAQPPLATNEFVLGVAKKNRKLIPVVNFGRKTQNPAEDLKRLLEKGAKALKLHPAADGDGQNCPRYHALLKAASESKIPVIIHTGRIYNKVYYRNPDSGSAELFSSWFETYPDLKFVLAHMNFHKPVVAYELAEKFENVYMDTSWQPSESIGEAVRRVGAERILFATDWPFIGDNFSVNLQRIQRCVDAGMLTPGGAELILWKNATRLLKLEDDAS